MVCWRSRSAKITVWLLFRCNGPFRGGRHLSPRTPLVQALQIERSCGCQRFVISLWCNTPPMPPQWTPETMERAFAQRGRQIFAKACPKSGPPPRNDWISEETWSALRVHGRLRSIFFRDVRRSQALLLKCVRCGRIFGTGEVVQETVPCPTYMDDLTILMEADSYESLLVKLAASRQTLVFSSTWHLERRRQW